MRQVRLHDGKIYSIYDASDTVLYAETDADGHPAEIRYVFRTTGDVDVTVYRKSASGEYPSPMEIISEVTYPLVTIL